MVPTGWIIASAPRAAAAQTVRFDPARNRTWPGGEVLPDVAASAAHQVAGPAVADEDVQEPGMGTCRD